MKIPHSAHATVLSESALGLRSAHAEITTSAAAHAERHTAAMDQLRKEVELSNAVQQGLEKAAGHL
jgi:hypothetical protein